MKLAHQEGVQDLTLTKKAMTLQIHNLFAFLF